MLRCDSKGRERRRSKTSAKRAGGFSKNNATYRLDCIVINGDGPHMAFPGGKGRLYQSIISMMPPHDTYIETHLGSGVVLRMKKPARRSVAVDIDPLIIASAKNWHVPDLELHNGDAATFLRKCPPGINSLVYVDPPYVGSTKKNRRYYRFEYTDQDHVELLEVLNSLKCYVLISGYDSELYQRYLPLWRRRNLVNITHGGLRNEVVWSNFEGPADLHDFRNVGESFRERERIKRKAHRWLKNLERMPAVERHAILDTILSSTAVDRAFARRRLRDDSSGSLQ
jgi:DNA adenine methylase